MNFMPFGQLKSLKKILIEVQYEQSSKKQDTKVCPALFVQFIAPSERANRSPIRSLRAFASGVSDAP